MPTYRFQEIATSRVKKYVDPTTGKKRTKTMKFYQTENPFNKDYKGNVKSRHLIQLEINAEAEAWVAQEGIAPLPRAKEDEIHRRVQVEFYKESVIKPETAASIMTSVSQAQNGEVGASFKQDGFADLIDK